MLRDRIDGHRAIAMNRDLPSIGQNDSRPEFDLHLIRCGAKPEHDGLEWEGRDNFSPIPEKHRYPDAVAALTWHIDKTHCGDEPEVVVRLTSHRRIFRQVVSIASHVRERGHLIG